MIRRDDKEGSEIAVTRRHPDPELEIFRSRVAFPIRPDLVAHAHAFDQACVARFLDGRNMDEEVLAAIVRNDKAIALCRVEPFDLASRHQRKLRLFRSIPRHFLRASCTYPARLDSTTRDIVNAGCGLCREGLAATGPRKGRSPRHWSRCTSRPDEAD